MPRFLHKWYAHVMGYFWLPCSVCHRMFGGHECSDFNRSVWVEGHENAVMVCPKCHRSPRPLPGESRWVEKGEQR